MQMGGKRLAAAAAAIVLAAPAMAWADEAALKAEVDRLQAQVEAQAARIDRLEGLLSAQATAPKAPAAPAAKPAAVPATAAATQSVEVAQAPEAPATSIGGYGEATYNAYLNDGSRNQADLERFVLFFAHRFSDRLSFSSELEVEHAISSSGDKGEAEVEQAHLDYRLSEGVNLKAGLFLMPFGFLNRSHEPPTYYGVERNEVETRIIPTTWREGGVGLFGRGPLGIDYDVGLTTGFDVAKLDDASEPLASTHQELQLAHAHDLSVYGALEWKGVPGVLVGAAVFSGNTGQGGADAKAGEAAPDFSGIGARMTLWDVHARVQRGGFDLEALYAQGGFSDADALARRVLDFNQATGSDRPVPPRRFYGWLVQGAYSFNLGREVQLSPFARYEQYDTQASLPLGLQGDPANRDRVITLGASLRPLPEIVLKADWQKFLDHPDNNRVNVGLGYMF
jgi:hypothetical protein